MSRGEPIGAVNASSRTVLLTRAEVCDLLRISRPTLDRWVTSGRLQRLHIGPRTVRYSTDEVLALIEAKG